MNDTAMGSVSNLDLVRQAVEGAKGLDLDDTFLEPGECLAQSGDAEQSLVAVVSGIVAAYRSNPQGKEQITSLFFPGDLVVTGRLGAPWKVTIKALAAAQVRHLTKPALQALFQERPQLAYNLFQALCEDMSRREDRLHRLLTLPVECRVASFLIDLGQRLGRMEGQVLCVPLPIRRSEVAEFLCVRTETLSRLVSRWRREGMIELRGPRYIRIPDPRKLTWRPGASAA